MVKNTKTWMSWERNIIFLRNKKILNLCVRWLILRSYHFVAEVTFNMLQESILWWKIIYAFHFYTNSRKLQLPILQNMSVLTVVFVFCCVLKESNIHIYFSYVSCKERLVVNGMASKVLYCEGQIIFLKCGNNVVPVFPVYCNGTPYYPIVAGYASTIHKIMGQTLRHVILVFNYWYLSPAVGYVALSRVSSLDNVVAMLRQRKKRFINY